MNDPTWKDRLERGREVLHAKRGSLSASARAAAEGASARVTDVYGQARGQIERSAAATRRNAEHLAEFGTHRLGSLGEDARELGTLAWRNGRDALDRAGIASRGLIADRPLTAVALGIGAGLVLGVLANRLAQRRQADAEREAEDEDEWYQ